MTGGKRVKKVSKRFLVSVGILTSVSAGLVGYDYYNSGNIYQENKATTLKLTEKQNEINGYLDSTDKKFLKDDTNIEELESKLQQVQTEKEKLVSSENKSFLFNSEINKSRLKINEEKEELEEIIANAKIAVQFTKDAKELFTNDIKLSKNNSKLLLSDRDLVINEKITKDKIREFSDKYKEDCPEWLSNYVENIEKVATKQVEEKDNATNATNKLFKDNKVASLNEKEYETAVSEVNKIKNEAVKKGLTTKLDSVKKAIDEEKARLEKERKEKEEAERKAREKAEAEAQAQAQKAQTSTYSASTSSSSSSRNASKSSSGSTSSGTANSSSSTSATTTNSIPSSGVYINGVSSPIGYYSSNGGAVPLYTNVAYLWTLSGAPSNYYLIDYTNSAGLGTQVLNVGVGQAVYINGQKFTVSGSKTVYAGASTDSIDWNHRAFLQTCYSNSDANGMRLVYLD